VQISDMNDAQLASNRPNACSWPATGRMPAAAGERAGPTGLHVYSKPWQGGLGGGRGREELAERRELRRLVADVVREVAALRHDGQARAGHQAVQRAAGHVWHLRARERCVPHNPTLPSVPPCPPAVGRLFAASRTPTAAQRSALQHRQTAARHASARKCTGGRASASFLHCTPQRLQGQHGSDSAGATAADCSERARACRSPVPCQKCVAAASRGGSRDTLNAQCRPRKRAKSSNSGAPLRWRRLSGTIVCGRGCQGSEPRFEECQTGTTAACGSASACGRSAPASLSCGVPSTVR